jgi:hypothetical protein
MADDLTSLAAPVVPDRIAAVTRNAARRGHRADAVSLAAALLVVIAYLWEFRLPIAQQDNAYSLSLRIEPRARTSAGFQRRRAGRGLHQPPASGKARMARPPAMS